MPRKKHVGKSYQEKEAYMKQFLKHNKDDSDSRKSKIFSPTDEVSEPELEEEVVKARNINKTQQVSSVRKFLDQIKENSIGVVFTLIGAIFIYLFIDFNSKINRDLGRVEAKIDQLKEDVDKINDENDKTIEKLNTQGVSIEINKNNIHHIEKRIENLPNRSAK